jgi:hypothetical protein
MWGFHESWLSSCRPKKLTAFVSTGKISPMVIRNGKCEKFAGVNFTVLVFSIFISRFIAKHLYATYSLSVLSIWPSKDRSLRNQLYGERMSLECWNVKGKLWKELMCLLSLYLAISISFIAQTIVQCTLVSFLTLFTMLTVPKHCIWPSICYFQKVYFIILLWFYKNESHKT